MESKFWNDLRRDLWNPIALWYYWRATRRIRKANKVSSKQTCFVYCPQCSRDLCSTDGVTVTDTDLVRYVCVCGLMTSWDFDSYPVPVLVMEKNDA